MIDLNNPATISLLACPLLLAGWLALCYYILRDMKRPRKSALKRKTDE